MKCCLFLFLSACHFHVTGQWGSVRAGLPFLPMTVYSAKQQDVFSITGNPAAGAFIRRRGAGIFAESRFIPAGVHFFSGSAALPLRRGSLGLYGSFLRAGAYSESDAGFVYSLSLGSFLSAGVGFSFSSAKALSYSNRYVLHSSLGLVLTPLPGFRAGIYARDPAGLYITSASRETAFTSFCFGMGYEPSSQFYCGVEFLCESQSAAAVSVFLQYALREKFFLRSGFMTASESFFAGAGFAIYGWQLMFLVSHHPMLGPNSSLLLTYPSVLN